MSLNDELYRQQQAEQRQREEQRQRQEQADRERDRLQRQQEEIRRAEEARRREDSERLNKGGARREDPIIDSPPDIRHGSSSSSGGSVGRLGGALQSGFGLAMMGALACGFIWRDAPDGQWVGYAMVGAIGGFILGVIAGFKS